MYTLPMELITKEELIDLAKMQDPEPELYKISFWDLKKLEEQIKKLVQVKQDDKLFSILMKLQSHIMIVQDWVREQEIKKTQKHESLEEFVCYLNKSKMMGSGKIYA